MCYLCKKFRLFFKFQVQEIFPYFSKAKQIQDHQVSKKFSEVPGFLSPLPPAQTCTRLMKSRVESDH